MSLENLYGRAGVQPETQLAGLAFTQVASLETAHPADRARWSLFNPTLGHCDVASELCKQIWGVNLSRSLKWNPEAKFLTWWAYEDYGHFLAAVKKNKIDVHHSFFHPKYGEIDLTRNQFPDQIYLHSRPRPLSHERPITRSWSAESKVPERLEKLLGVFVPAFLNLINQAQTNPTPELELFLQSTT